MTIIPAGDSLLNWTEQPLLFIRKSVLAFLQGLFEQADSGHFQWLENLEDTEIIITDESPIKIDTVGKRPALSVIRSPVQWGQTSLDEMRETNLPTGGRTHTDLLSGSVSINCCSRSDLESEYLAWIVAEHIWKLRRLLIRHTPIHSFGRGISIGSVSPAGALVQGSTEGEWLATPVTIPIYLQTSFNITPLDQTIVRQIEARMGVRGNVEVSPTGVRRTVNTVIRGPRIRGQAIRDIAFEQSLTEKE